MSMLILAAFAQELEAKLQENAVEMARYENQCSELSQLVSQVTYLTSCLGITPGCIRGLMRR